MNFYRYNQEYGEDGTIYIEVETYVSIKETAKGYWVVREAYANSDFWRDKLKRMVYPKSHRPWCHADKQAALQAYAARKRRQLAFLRRDVEAVSRICERLDGNPADEARIVCPPPHFTLKRITGLI